MANTPQTNPPAQPAQTAQAPSAPKAHQDRTLLWVLGILLSIVLLGWGATSCFPRSANEIQVVEVATETPTPAVETNVIAASGAEATMASTVVNNATAVVIEAASNPTLAGDLTAIAPNATETPEPTATGTVVAVAKADNATATSRPKATTTAETVNWQNIGNGRRVEHSQNGSYGPEIGHSRPGYGTSSDEIMTVVGHTLSFMTEQGEVILDSGCQQAILGPNTYAKNAGGEDWGFVGWYWNDSLTQYIDEMAVLSFQLAKQQIEWEECEDLPDTELLDHVLVVEMHPENHEWVTLTPWSEWRRASGENHVIMYAPGDNVYGWTIYDSSGNISCNDGNCLLEEAPDFGWFGGGIANSTWPGEIPAANAAGVKLVELP